MFGVQSILLMMWTGEYRNLERNWMNNELHRAFIFFFLGKLFNIEKCSNFFFNIKKLALINSSKIKNKTRHVFFSGDKTET